MSRENRRRQEEEETMLHALLLFLFLLPLAAAVELAGWLAAVDGDCGPPVSFRGNGFSNFERIAGDRRTEVRSL